MFLVFRDDALQLLLHAGCRPHLEQDATGLLRAAPEHQPARTLGHEEEPHKHDEGGKCGQPEHEPGPGGGGGGGGIGEERTERSVERWPQMGEERRVGAIRH